MFRPVLLSLALLATPLAAQTEAASPHDLALAAGYKAAFLCSGIFNAGQSEDQIAADDLTGIYPEYRPLIGDFDATVDREQQRVSVAWSQTMPPRVAQWRPHLGCAQLPIGARAEAADGLPRVTGVAEVDLEASDRLAWPQGDRDAIRPLPAGERFDTVIGKGFDRASYGEGTETTAVVVVQAGRIVGERYRQGYDMHTPQRTWSVAKSIAASVIGAAAQQGLIDVADPAPVPAWRAEGDPRGAITLTDLFRMSSGLWSPTAGNRTDDIYFGGMAVRDAIAGLPLEAAPGRAGAMPTTIRC